VVKGRAMSSQTRTAKAQKRAGMRNLRQSCNQPPAKVVSGVHSVQGGVRVTGLMD
jgi:hypothetical protein